MALLLQRVLSKQLLHTLQGQLVLALRFVVGSRRLQGAPASVLQLRALGRQPVVKRRRVVQRQAVGGRATPMAQRVVVSSGVQGFAKGMRVACHRRRQREHVAFDMQGLGRARITQPCQLAAQVAPPRGLIQLRPQQRDHARPRQRAAAAEQDQQGQRLLHAQRQRRAVAAQPGRSKDLQRKHRAMMPAAVARSIPWFRRPVVLASLRRRPIPRGLANSRDDFPVSCLLGGRRGL